MSLKHVIVEGDHSFSLYAMEFCDQDFQMKKLAGHNMPVQYLVPAIEAAFPKLLEEAEEWHRIRKAPWIIRRRVGTSGCVDYMLYILADEKWIDQKRMATLHVSMSRKIGSYLHYWIGDLPPILAAVVQDFPPEAPYNIKVYTPELYTGYKEPGEPSGLKEALEAIRAMEVLQDE